MSGISRNIKIAGNLAFIISAALCIATLVMTLLPPAAVVAQQSGTVWTTDICGTGAQDANHYPIGAHVYVNFTGFAPGTYDWFIAGNPGSCDSNINVITGSLVVVDTGLFCFDAYTVASDDCGVYKVDFGGKTDNYSVDPGLATFTFTPSNTPLPTDTFTPSSTFTNTPTFPPTSTFTDTSTLTPTSTFTNTSTFTSTSTFTPSSTFTPTSTGTITPAPPTSTFTQTNTPTNTPTPTNSPTATSTFIPSPSSTVTLTPAPPPVDICPNLDGIQGTLPDGMVMVNGQCVIPEPVLSVTGADKTVSGSHRVLPWNLMGLSICFAGLGLVLHGFARWRRD